jgi:hypothetical protein
MAALNILHCNAHVALHFDIRDIGARLGQRVHSWCVAEVPWVARGRQDPYLTSTFSWASPGPDTCDRFPRRYGAHLQCFDAFIVDHPIWFAALFETLDKPVIAQVASRYDLGVTADPTLWRWLDGTLGRMYDRGRLIPLSNNRGDRAYAREHLGFDWPTIPSLCEYTGISYVGDRPEWLLASLARPPLPKPYAWSDLGRYRGIRHVPYNTSLMSFTEQYAAAIPLVVPSPGRLLQMALDDEMDAMAHASLLRHLRLPPGDGWNDYRSPDVLQRWIALCDWYDEEWMPHVISLDDAPFSAALGTLDARTISARMASFNIDRRKRILEAWRGVLGRCEKDEPARDDRVRRAHLRPAG